MRRRCGGRQPSGWLWVRHDTAAAVAVVGPFRSRAVRLFARLGDRPALMTSHRETQFRERARIGDVDPVDLQTAFLAVEVLERGLKCSGEWHVYRAGAADSPSGP